MKRFAALLTALLLLYLPISGCSREPTATLAEPSAEADSFELTEETLRRDEDVFSVLIGAVHYDEEGKTRFSSLTVLTRSSEGKMALLTIPKDTRTWVERYDEAGDYRFSGYGDIGSTFALARNEEIALEKTVESVQRLLGGVRVDRYVLVNSVQMQKLAALCPDGVYLTVQDAIRDYGIEAGYQNIAPHITDYAEYSYLKNIDGTDYPGTDQSKLERHQLLIRTFLQIFSQQLGAMEAEERAEAVQRILSCPMTDLTAQELSDLLTSAELSFEEDEILPGTQMEIHDDSFWIADGAEVKKWVLAHFYPQKEA